MILKCIGIEVISRVGLSSLADAVLVLALLTLPAPSYLGISDRVVAGKSERQYGCVDMRSRPYSRLRSNEIKNATFTRSTPYSFQLCRRLSSCESPKAVYDVLYQHHINFTKGLFNLNSVCLTTAFHRIAKWINKDKTESGSHMIGQVVEEILRRLQNASVSAFEPRHLSNIAWSAARVGVKNLSLFAGLEKEITKTGLSFFKPQELSNIAWAWATSDFPTSTLLGNIQRQFIKLTASSKLASKCAQPLGTTQACFKAQEIKDIAWASARLHLLKPPQGPAIPPDPAPVTAVAASVTLVAASQGSSLAAPEGEIPATLRAAAAAESAEAETAEAETAGATGTATGSAGMVAEAGGTAAETAETAAGAAGKAGAAVGNGFWMAVEAAAVGVGVEGLRDSELGILLWSLGKARYAAPALFSAAGDVIRRRDLRHFSPQSIANTAWACASLGHSQHPLFAAAEAALLPPQASKRSAWPSGAAGVGKLSAFGPQELKDVLWAFSTAGAGSPALYDALADECIRGGGRAFSNQELCNVVWAFLKNSSSIPTRSQQPPNKATARHDHSALKTVKELESTNAQDNNVPSNDAGADGDYEVLLERSCSAHALALRPKVARCLDTLVGEALRRGPTCFSCHDLRFLVWASGKASALQQNSSSTARGFLCAAGKELASRSLLDLSPGDLRDLAWSFASVLSLSPPANETADVVVLALVDAVAYHAPRLGLFRFRSQELVVLSWSIVKVRQLISCEDFCERKNVSLFLAAVDDEWTKRDLSALLLKDVSNILWTYAVSGRRHEGVLASLCNRLPHLPFSSAQPQDVSNVLWSLARLGLEGKIVSDVFEHAASIILGSPGRLEAFKPQELGNVAWAFASSGGNKDIARLFSEVVASRSHDFDSASLKQVGQLILASFLSPVPRWKQEADWSNASSLTHVELLGPDPSTWHEAGAHASHVMAVREAIARACVQDDEIKSSGLHLQVSRCVGEMGLRSVNEVALYGGVYHIDIVIEMPAAPCGRRRLVAVEVDGPTHFEGDSRYRHESEMPALYSGGLDL